MYADVCYILEAEHELGQSIKHESKAKGVYECHFADAYVTNAESNFGKSSNGPNILIIGVLAELLNNSRRALRRHQLIIEIQLRFAQKASTTNDGETSTPYAPQNLIARCLKEKAD